MENFLAVVLAHEMINGFFDRWIEEGVRTEEDRPKFSPVMFKQLLFKPKDVQCPLKVGDVVFYRGNDPKLPKVNIEVELVLHEPPLVSEASFNAVISAIVDAVKEVIKKLEPHL